METPGVNLSLNEQKAAAALYLHQCFVCYTVMQTHSDTREESVKKSSGEQEHPSLTSTLKLPGALTMKHFLISSAVDLCSHYRVRHLSMLGK